MVAVLSPESEEGFFFARSEEIDLTRPLLTSVASATQCPAAASAVISPLNMPQCGHMLQFPGSDSNLAFADANPVDGSLPTPPMTEPERLRLPSFASLGIATPHPDDAFRSPQGINFLPVRRDPIHYCTNESNDHDVDMYSDLGGEVQDVRPHSQATISTREMLRPALKRNAQVLTPPDESSRFTWLSTTQHASIATSEGERPEPLDQGRAIVTVAQVSESPRIAEEASEPRPVETGKWFETAITSIVSSLNLTSLPGQSPRILSHALPSPSIPGHAFPDVIEKIRASSPPSQMTWINLLHAVPGQFKLSDLPSSPPTTPGMPLGAGDDYFTTKIIESAVTSIDYDEGGTTIPVHHQPLATPSSIHLAIVERYIPPTNANEFSNLFSLNKPSLLVDRMVELAPGHGCLVFVYPTKKGAKTFMNDHLSPILDPLLRTIAILNNYSADLGNSIAHMAAVDNMFEYDTLRRKITILCKELNRDLPTTRHRLHGIPGKFSLLYSDKRGVKFDRNVWVDWWIKQEKPRVRAAVRDYFRAPGRHSCDDEFTPAAMLIQKILDGVATRTCEVEMDTEIEVGLFVIKRD